MHCPRLHELPRPEEGKTGWPWTEESQPLVGAGDDVACWPKITVVTPSFNQGPFLEETIRSILLQGYPNLEYMIFDGGSTDESVQIIQKYSPWLKYWKSAPDSGQSDAINQGLRMGTGLFATWINSDDMLCKNALVRHASQIGFDPKNFYVGDCLYANVNGEILFTRRGNVRSLEDLVRVRSVWRSNGNIVQPEVLFPLKMALKIGGLDPCNHFTMDYELWGMFLLAGLEIRYSKIPFGIFRLHQEQKTHNGLRQTRALLDTAKKLCRMNGAFTTEKTEDILEDLESYWECYQRTHWRNSGRLANMGLPVSLVNGIRTLRERFSYHG